MPVPDKLWQLVLLLVLLPPVGALYICLSGISPRWLKLVAVAYCAAVILFLLLYRPDAGPIVVDAQAWERVGVTYG